MLYYDPSVKIRLAHRLYTDFQYFLCFMVGTLWKILWLQEETGNRATLRQKVELGSGAFDHHPPTQFHLGLIHLEQNHHLPTEDLVFESS